MYSLHIGQASEALCTPDLTNYFIEKNIFYKL